MAKVERLARGRVRVRVEDVEIKKLDDYLTTHEMLDMIEHLVGRRWHINAVIWWIAEGWLPASKAGDGKRAAWLIRRDHARAFAEFLRQRHGGEVLGTLAACRWLGERLRGPGEKLSHNTLRTWVDHGLIYPVNPDAATLKFAIGELEAFAAWFGGVKVWRYGQWAVPSKARRALWELPDGAIKD